jgi:hypothetical protein
MPTEENVGKTEFVSDQLASTLYTVELTVNIPLTVDVAVDGTADGLTDITTGGSAVRTYPELILEKYSVIW